MTKIYQIHTIMEINTTPVRSIEYKLAKNIDDALTEDGYKKVSYPADITDETRYEVYAIEVSKQTLIDEISQCEYLISEWKKNPKYPKVDVIITRQKNLIKYYKKILKNV